MQKIDKLLVSLNEWIAKADTDDFIASLPADLEVLDMLPGYVEEFEKEIAKLLRKQKKYFVDGIKNYTKKDAVEKGIKIKDIIDFVTGSLFGADTFAKSLSKAARKFLDYTMKDMTKAFMDAIDPEIQFNIFVQIAFLKPDCKRVFQDVQNVNQMQGKYYVVLSTQTLIAYGKVIAQLRFTFPNNKVIETCKLAFTVDESIMSDDAMKSTNEFPVIQKAIEAGEKLKNVDIEGIIAAGELAKGALPKTGGTMTGTLNMQASLGFEGDRNLYRKDSSGTFDKGFIINNTNIKMHDWKNNRTVWDYEQPNNMFNMIANTNLLKKNEAFYTYAQPNGRTFQLREGNDLNDYLDTGLFAGAKLVNAPSQDYLYIEVIRYADANYTMQRATTLVGSTVGTWVRRKTGTTWNPWERMIDQKGGVFTGDLIIDRPNETTHRNLFFGTNGTADVSIGQNTSRKFLAWDQAGGNGIWEYDKINKTFNVLAPNTNLMKKAGDTATGHMIFRHNINQETADGLQGVNMVVNSSVNKWSVAPKMDGNPVWANEFAMDLNTGKVTVPSLGTKKDGRANISITADGELISGNGVIADRRGNTVTLRAGVRRKVGIPHTNAIFTLPVDMRPLLTVQQNTISTDGTPCLITIQTNGEFSI
ncbi:BppU family phage baseplate upper protein [Bacillus cereus group sp. TH163-1LC]|nr:MULTISPECIES: BppU family phage baseplate upper protein [unclassified Bacillus cereus group]MDA1647520.1 BppU family phage baseplate upper protein [Bacillus cereus group sp. TH163-1LC]MDA1797442.1 BppU family phage baseplate upper protein [Bacillus cereus group sp. BY8-1LC]MDA1882782.1 BppU family phage baseplate upper protein [Bacillus cereus group sp. BY10-2LC]